MNDKELADAVVALGVGDMGAMGTIFWPDDNHWIGIAKFVRDWRVAGALMEMGQAHFIEKLTEAKWAVRSDKRYGEGKTRVWYDDESLPRAIIEACVSALDRRRS